jgi:hypothetical protein
MKNLVLFDSEAGKVIDYPRADEEPVQQLNPRYQVLRIMREAKPEYDPATHYIRETRTVDLDAAEWRWGWELIELPPPPPPQPDYVGFYRALLGSQVYSAVLNMPATAELARAMVVFVSAIQDCMAGRPEPQSMQAAIWLLLGQVTLSNEHAAELSQLFAEYRMDVSYSLQP